MAARYLVEIALTAELDIEGIADHLASENAVAARKWQEALVRQHRTLSTFPARGAVIPEAALLGVEYRHLLHGRYRTIYRIFESRVVVVRVVHGARQLAGSLPT